MSRKYRQQGYQDRSGKSDDTRKSQAPRFREGPRSPRMPGMRNVIKCTLCGGVVKTSLEDIDYSSQCPACSSDLHTCKNCVFFDPASRFECSQPIPKRIAPKDKRADCEYFQIRTIVEKITSSSDQNPDDARSAFENLFKS